MFIIPFLSAKKNLEFPFLSLIKWVALPLRTRQCWRRVQLLPLLKISVKCTCHYQSTVPVSNGNQIENQMKQTGRMFDSSYTLNLFTLYLLSQRDIVREKLRRWKQELSLFKHLTAKRGQESVWQQVNCRRDYVAIFALDVTLKETVFFSVSPCRSPQKWQVCHPIKRTFHVERGEYMLNYRTVDMINIKRVQR